jgi:hypothetical protein
MSTVNGHKYTERCENKEHETIDIVYLYSYFVHYWAFYEYERQLNTLEN